MHGTALADSSGLFKGLGRLDSPCYVAQQWACSCEMDDVNLPQAEKQVVSHYTGQEPAKREKALS